MAKIVLTVAASAADLGGLGIHERNDQMIGKAFALDAEVVDIVAKPVFHESMLRRLIIITEIYIL